MVRPLVLRRKVFVEPFKVDGRLIRVFLNKGDCKRLRKIGLGYKEFFLLFFSEVPNLQEIKREVHKVVFDDDFEELKECDVYVSIDKVSDSQELDENVGKELES